MYRFVVTVSLVAIGFLCGTILFKFFESDEVVITEYLCPDAETDNYANIDIDDERLKVSYNPRGHWSPRQRYWVSSLIHNEEIVIWQVESCRGWVEGEDGREDIMTILESCVNGGRLSELWVLERTAGRLSMWIWANDGSLRRDSRLCLPLG